MRRLRSPRVRLSEARGGSLNGCDWSQTGGLIISSTDRRQPTFPRSAACERRNPVRVLPMYAAYMGIMASMCASPAELAESSSPYRHLARDTQRVKAAGEWVRDAEGDDFEILLQALQIEIRAEKGRGELSGIIPEYASPCNHPDVCTMVTKSVSESPSIRGIAPSI